MELRQYAHIAWRWSWLLILGAVLCAALLAPLLFDWAYEHPILLVGAALLLPQTPFVPAAERLPLLVRSALVASTLLLSLAADGRILDLEGNWPLVCSVAISLIALMFIGRTGPYTVAVAVALRERRKRYRYPEERPIVG